MSIKTIVVDDHPVVRLGIRQMLSADDEIEVVAELESIDGIIEALNDSDADLVLLDLELENTHGVEALQLLRDAAPDVSVIIYTSHDDDERIIQAAELGVDGYLLKGCGQRELVEAIHSVSSGEIALESRVAGKLMKHMNRRSAKMPTVQFSKREVQVLEQLATGKTNRDIGEALFISESTVKFHVHAILNKLDATNRTEAVSRAAQQGIVKLSA